MSKTVKYILIGVGVLALLAFIAYFVAIKNAAPGGIIAVLAGLWASIKSKVFNTSNLEEEITGIQEEHTEKREEWGQIKEEYDSKFRTLEERMKYLDYKSARISEQLGELDQQEEKLIKDFNSKTVEEKFKILDSL